MEELIKIVAETLRVDPSKLSNLSKMTDIPEWDSLSHMSLIAELEEKYNIQFTGDDIASMQSISEINEKIILHIDKKN
tara:strand:- start:732 stop:965 length:234 start_codon:yes stop_codon:yes gene_type:complete